MFLDSRLRGNDKEDKIATPSERRLAMTFLLVTIYYSQFTFLTPPSLA